MISRNSSCTVAVVAVCVAACDLTVTNPGRITEDALNEPTTVTRNVIVNGLIGDVEEALSALVLHTGLASDELNFAGTRSWLDFFSRGDIRPSDTNETWEPAATAAWTTVNGIERLASLQATPDQLATANLYAGFIHRMMGDAFCTATFDGGPELENVEYYRRALNYFQAAAAGSGQIRLAALAGQAQTHLILADYAAAASAAGQVPDNFLWVAHYTDNDESLIWSETHNQTQVTVFATPIADLGENGDPRTPWVDAKRLGAGGSVPFYRQEKYRLRTDDIPLAKGLEMRLIEAEALIRAGNVQAGMDRINYVRGKFGLAPQTASTATAAMAALDFERLVTLWLEARRLKDNDRLDNPYLEGRDRCFPFSDSEYNSNPNLTRPNR
jgi:hypothetical protein